MSHPPELAGGEGFAFEGDAAAFYLTALLAEALHPASMIEPLSECRCSPRGRNKRSALRRIGVAADRIDSNKRRGHEPDGFA